MKISILLEDLLLELSPTEIYKTYYKDINYAVFKYFVMFDPQTVIQDNKIVRLGKYSKLLLHLYRTQGLRMEDAPKAKEYLSYVYKYHIPLDVKKIESLSDIYNSVKKYMVVDTQDFDTAIKSLSRGKDYEVLMDGQQWLILQPLTEKGSCYLGVGTQWCTTYGPYSTNKDYNERENRFGQYNRQGPLYIIIDKGYKPNKFQFHFESNQFMSPEDSRIDVAGFLEKNPEIKNFFFPSFVRRATEDELKLEMKHIGILSQDDALKLIRKFSELQGIKNSLAISILNKDREKVAQLIQDDNLSNEVYLDGNWIVFDFDKLSYEIGEVKDYLRRLDYDKSNAWDHVYSDQQEGMDSPEQWNDTLEPIFKEYYEKNSNMIRYDLGAFNYELFKGDFFQGFYEDETIQDAYLESVTKKSYENFEFRVDTEINEVKKYLNIDGNEVKVSLANFIPFITKNEIEKIEGNLNDVMESYLGEYNLDNFEYDYYYDYERSYPTYDDIGNSVDSFFENLTDDVEGTRQCVEIRKKFNDIYNRIFKNNQTYENDHVYIHIVDLKVNCDNGSVKIIYKNKDKNKTYNGYVKVENLPVYATNYELFEAFSTFHKNAIVEQSDIKELQGISPEARTWAPIIKNHLKLGKNSPNVKIEGGSYPNEYKSFPIDQISMVVDKKYGGGGGYDEQMSGYDENGKYHANFVFGPLADIPTITHELRHAYEDYMRISKGNQPMKQAKEAVNIFGGDFIKFMQEENYPGSGYYGPLNGLIAGLYYTSKIERSAYSETVYEDDKFVRTIIDYINSLVKINDLSYIESHYNPEVLKEMWKNFKDKYRIPITDKFKDIESFLKWASDEIQYKGRKTLKKLRNVQYHSRQRKKEGGV